VDKNRQRKPSYYVWQKENAPAHVQLEWAYDSKGVPAGFRARVERRSEQEIPSYPLIHYGVEWRVLDQDLKKIAEGTQSLPILGPAQSVVGKWQGQTTPALRLEILLRRSDGSLAQSRILTWREPQQRKLTESEVESEVQSTLNP
jgi:hypothetical protein